MFSSFEFQTPFFTENGFFSNDLSLVIIEQLQVTITTYLISNLKSVPLLALNRGGMREKAT